MRPPSPSIPEKEFLYDSLRQSLRLDGRKPLELRNLTISFGPELGWVECALGDTKYEKETRGATPYINTLSQSHCTS